MHKSIGFCCNEQKSANTTSRTMFSSFLYDPTSQSTSVKLIVDSSSALKMLNGSYWVFSLRTRLTKGDSSVESESLLMSLSVVLFFPLLFFDLSLFLTFLCFLMCFPFDFLEFVSFSREGVVFRLFDVKELDLALIGSSLCKRECVKQ